MQKTEYALVVGRKRITVTKEVYKAYYRSRNREKYLDRLAMRHNISLEASIEDGISVEHMIASMEETFIDTIVRREMLRKLESALAKLSPEERKLIRELYFLGKSERQLSKETGVPPMTIHNRKRSILKKIKNLMER